MIVSKSKNFVFIEVPKTASTSIRSQLSKYDDYGHDLGKHAPARIVRAHIGAATWNKMHSFAVIRSPQDWVKSWYNFWRGITLSEDLPVSDKRHVGNISFDEFVEQAVSAKVSDRYGSIGHQYTKVCNIKKDRVIVKSLICFDYVSQEFNRFCKELDLSDVASLPMKNVSKFKSKGDKMDAGTIDRINTHWSADLELYQNIRQDAQVRYGDGS